MGDAVIVAGGRSTRFGDRDKAVAELAGVPMIRRVADRLVGVTDRLVVNCRADQRASIAAALEGYPPPVAFAIDPTPDEGPMAGIRAGLDAARTPYAFVVACDMPFVQPEFVSHLFDRAMGHDAAVPRTDDGWYQPTHAVYRADAMRRACDRALAAGERRIVAPLEELDVVVIDEDEVREHAELSVFESLDTRAAFEAAAERLS